MQGFRPHPNGVIWSRNYETLLLEAWGRDSFRVRATVQGEPRDDLFSVLQPPGEAEVQVTLTDDGVLLRNGALTAHISAAGRLRFLRSESGEELVAEIPTAYSPRKWSRFFQSAHGALIQAQARVSVYEC